MVFLFLAEGFEDIEALATVDVLRRASVAVTTVSITGARTVKSAHGVGVVTDALFETIEHDLGSAQLMILPGGLPGSTNLAAHAPLCAALKSQAESGRLIAAICAAPLVLGRLGILTGRKATCYPGVEPELAGAECSGALVQADGNIVTGKGPAAAFEFAYTLVDILKGEGASAPLRAGMLYDEL